MTNGSSPIKDTLAGPNAFAKPKLEIFQPNPKVTHSQARFCPLSLLSSQVRGHGKPIQRLANISLQMGRILPLLSRAVCRATMPDIPHAEVDYNLVQNNGPGAAQVVPHVR